jgi:hypothetical protein
MIDYWIASTEPEADKTKAHQIAMSGKELITGGLRRITCIALVSRLD